MTRGQSLAVIVIGLIAVAAFIQGVRLTQRLNGAPLKRNLFTLV